MKITYKGDYALKAVLDLALHYASEIETIHDIAKRIDAPVKFLEQILLDLKRGGFIESKRGKVGGYRLSKPPDKISVADVVRLIEGPLEPIACVKQGYAECRDVYKCAFRPIWQNVAKATSDIIDNITFEALAKQANANQEAIAYTI